MTMRISAALVVAPKVILPFGKDPFALGRFAAKPLRFVCGHRPTLCQSRQTVALWRNVIRTVLVSCWFSAAGLVLLIASSSERQTKENAESAALLPEVVTIECSILSVKQDDDSCSNLVDRAVY